MKYAKILLPDNFIQGDCEHCPLCFYHPLIDSTYEDDGFYNDDEMDEWYECTIKECTEDDPYNNVYGTHNNLEENCPLEIMPDLKEGGSIIMTKRDINNINLQIDNIDFWSPHGANKGGMRIYWSADIGFGTLDIVKRGGLDGEDFESPEEDLVLTVDTECMASNEDKTFINKILSLLTEKLEIVG